VFNEALLSSKSDHWSTPAATYDALNEEFGFTFDPCPLMSTEDGRKVKWTGRVFCNPPYSRITEFLKKGLYHLASGDCELLVYLIPARTGRARFAFFAAGSSSAAARTARRSRAWLLCSRNGR
jgi:hypothetical protein